MIRYQAVHSDGNKSIGVAFLKRDIEKKIYAFSVYGKTYWSGDLQTYRKTKKEAYIDAGIKFSSVEYSKKSKRGNDAK